MPSHPESLAPTRPGERLLELDVLRGLCLFGVLLVNLGAFSGSDWALEAGLPHPMGWGGSALVFLRQVLLESKAAALLSMLFGAGLAIQMEGALRKGRAYAPFAFRRAGALALLGLAHSLLLWNVDILLDYAVISLLVLPFLGLRPSRILWAIPALLLVTVLIAAPFLKVGESLDSGRIYALGLEHYGRGGWMEGLRYRAWELVHFMGPTRIANRLPILSPFFVLGVAFWKWGFLAKPADHRRSLLRIFWICFGLGLLANLMPQAALHAWVAGIPFRPLRILIKAGCFFMRPALTLGYAAGILLLMQHPRWRDRLAVFAPLGRMALTQYLLQSLVCTWVFNGFGLGLYGRLPLSWGLLGGAAFYAFQAWSSVAWLRRFRTGPAEWLWRRLAYGKVPSLQAPAPHERPSHG